jgi:trehalose 6-phosphate synthase/phosphatase
MPDRRRVIVSNRLPIAVTAGSDGLTIEPAGGGLATGLRPWHERSGGLWIGWPGDVSGFTHAQRGELDAALASRGIVAAHLSRDHVDRYYHGFANRVIWPLFHYQIDRVPVDALGWDAYQEANSVFADLVARHYRDGDTIWIHDYQLMLLPGMLRERLPDARIGFFLHIPFPSSEVFRILPWRRQVLSGLLGADLIGFHTFAYMRHFLASLLHIEGVEADIDCVHVADRVVKLGVFPMGVPAQEFAQLADEPEVVAEAAAIRAAADGRHIILGVDRLDYTKGIPRRLQAIERLLATQPEMRDRVRYIQVAVPSREEVDSYQRFKRQVEEGVGRINGECGTLRSVPVHYIHRAITRRQLAALYSAADVMLVTPLRDGMNLVAKEFVASRVDGDGVLVLSEFAGAAAELNGAVTVNPYDVDAVSRTIAKSLEMLPAERQARMKLLRRRVMDHDVHAWAAGFLSELDTVRGAGTVSSIRPEAGVITAVAELQRGHHLQLLLDYDGTLVPFAKSPELAAPDPDLIDLLGALAAAPGITVDVVSGRAPNAIEPWLQGLPIGIWAEHGYWRRERGADSTWQCSSRVPDGWLARIQPMLEQFTASTPGSRIELKTSGIAWHYRGAHRDFGARQAHELRMLLGDALSNQPLEVMEGKKVIEIRVRGVSKRTVAQHVLANAAPGASIVAIGDDRTDEELFRALPASSLTIAVGRLGSCARFHVEDHRAVRQLLRAMVATAHALRGATVTA